MTDLAEWLKNAIDQREQLAWAACARPGDPAPPEPERWHWVDADTDVPVDPAGFTYEYYDGRLALRSVQEYPTRSVGPLPHFVIPQADEVDVNVAKFLPLGDPQTVVRRCRADRNILARHERAVRLGDPDEDWNYTEVPYCLTCTMGNSCSCCVTEDEDWEPWPCATIRDLAEGYGYVGVAA